MPSSWSVASGGPLVCPRCALSYPLSERFCPNCEMPLVYAGTKGEGPVTETHERLRKIKPQYTRGEPVKVGFARNQAEAELIQGLLLEEGIPSFLKRSAGFDVPDFLAAGPRDVLVPEAGADTARELLTATEIDDETEVRSELQGEAAEYSAGAGPSPARLAAWILLALILAAAIVGLLYRLTV
jgi:Putative prokaryotic signal transducing protein